MRSCILVTQLALIACAVMANVARQALHWRRNESYGLGDAVGSGAIAGACGIALGAAICVIRDGASQAGGGWLAAWAKISLPLAGLGLIEGAAFGAASAFALTMLSAKWGRK